MPKKTDTPPESQVYTYPELGLKITATSKEDADARAQEIAASR